MDDINEHVELLSLVNKSKKNVRFVHNYFCIKCSVVDRIMIKVGAITFCRECHEIEFGLKDTNPVKNQRDTYLKWLKEYNGTFYGG